MSSILVVALTFVVFWTLLALGHRSLARGADPAVANGAVLLVFATLAGVVFLVLVA